MAKQNMYPSSYIKNMDVYQNFSGGLNTKAANETLSEKEVPFLQNVDIADRGTLKRRTGMKSIFDYSAVETGTTAQGFFRYFYSDGSFKDIVAKNGYLYINGVKQSINGFTGQLQTTREMNGVQYKDSMYIATGTKLVVYNGTTFSTITPYQPTPLEALYVGLNGLSNDPEDFIQNGVSTVPTIQGVKMQEQYFDSNGIQQYRHAKYGLVNKAVKVTCFYSKPDNNALEFQFSWKKDIDKDGQWTLHTDWTTADNIMFSTGYAGVIQIKIAIRVQGSTATVEEYIVPKYLVKTTKGVDDEGTYSPTLETCNQIFVYWERLYLYGDTSETDTLYGSDVQNFDYFPLSNTIRFENDREEGISTVARFRDQLIVFTNSTTQTLAGKSPQDWSRQMVNSAVGCVAPKSVQSVANNLVFLAKDGIYSLKNATFNEANMNVERLDYACDDLTVVLDSKATSIVYDGQYHIVYPSLNRRMRFYYSLGAWTMDTSSHMDLTTFLTYDGLLFAQKSNGTIVQFDKTLFADLGEVYQAVIELKGYSFGEPYNPKKAKEVQIMIGDQDQATSCTLDVFADDTQIYTGAVSINVTTKQSNDPMEELNEIYKVRVSGKGHYLKARIKHTDSKPLSLIGLGFIYKVKKP